MSGKDCFHRKSLLEPKCEQPFERRQHSAGVGRSRQQHLACPPLSPHLNSRLRDFRQSIVGQKKVVRVFGWGPAGAVTSHRTRVDGLQHIINDAHDWTDLWLVDLPRFPGNFPCAFLTSALSQLAVSAPFFHPQRWSRSQFRREG